MRSELRLRMFLQNIKQADVAREAGVHFTYINRVVLGKQEPSERVKAAFRKFGLDVWAETPKQTTRRG